MAAPSASPTPLPEVALLVRQPWVSMILDGQKIWEMRGDACHRRGRVALACAGTGLLYGEANLIDCRLVACRDAGGTLVAAGRHEDFPLLPNNLDKHGLTPADFQAFDYRRWWAWVMDDPRWYPKPVPYIHPRGAVRWVRLAQPASASMAETSCKRARRA